MQLQIKVIPGAKANRIKKASEGWKIYLQAPPVEGKANRALVKFLAGYFGVSENAIEIIKGLKSRCKTINIRSI